MNTIKIKMLIILLIVPLFSYGNFISSTQLSTKVTTFVKRQANKIKLLDTFLRQAIIDNDPQGVQYWTKLITINRQDSNGITPLMLAIDLQHHNLAKILIKSNNADLSLRDAQGRTTLMRVIIKSKASILGSNNEIINLLSESSDNLNIKDEVGKTALMHALDPNNIIIAQRLLDRGADTNIKDNIGKTALIYGNDSLNSSLSAYAGGINTTLTFLSNLALQSNVNIKDDIGKTALIYAIISNRFCFAQHLLASGADVNILDDTGKTALHYAAEQRNANLVELLINHNALVNGKDLYEKTPLHYAAEQENTNAVLALLNAGADVNADARGFTPLDKAAENVDTNLNTIIALLSYGSITANNSNHYILQMINLIDHELNELPANSSIIGIINKYRENINSAPLNISSTRLKDILIKRLLSQQKYSRASQMFKEFTDLKNALNKNIYFANLIQNIHSAKMLSNLYKKHKHNQFNDIDFVFYS